MAYSLGYPTDIDRQPNKKEKSQEKQSVIKNICRLVCLWNVGAFAIYSFANQWIHTISY